MNEPLSITLLGGLEVQQGDRLITRFKSQKIGALLAYLAYHLPQMQSREILIEMLWPESILEAGRNSLSVALSTLRHQLEPPGTPANAVLHADRFSIGLNPAAVSTDVDRFEAAVQAAMKTENPSEQTQRLAAAADLYPGRLLPGFYDDWITAAQQHLAGLFLETVNRLIGRLEANGDLSGALGYARRAVALDPLGEQAHQHLLRLLAATGQIGAALRHYKELEQRLDEELSEEPSATLRALARQIEKQSGFTLPLVLPAATYPQPLRPPPVFAASPEGMVTLTFLLTDIEGSTQQWERTGDVFAQALASHHALLRHAFAQAGGQEITEAGDSFVVAFASAGKALTCAIAAQQTLHEHTWPPEVGALRVRMALHTGDVEFQEGTYHGLTLHRAARMLTTGHGGQILCSEATASLVRREPGEAVRLVDLGVWRLRDVPTPERLFQVEYPGMPEHPFPPLAAQSGQPAHLPLRFTRFFGRDGEIAHLVERLRPDPLLPTPPVRLVTLTGLGGAGKTRLAIEVAEHLVESFAGAVWFTPLADLTDPRLLVDTILDSLRLVRSPQQEPLEQVVEKLAGQPALLILDNFEQIVEGGAALVQTLLSRVPTLTLLVTSRQLLGLAGEEEFVVPPLNTPNGGETAAQLSLYDSVQLFVDRAQAAMPHFQVTSGNAPAVAELCHRLEGLPLAIELAAARALVLTPAQMLKQLEQRFGFLVSRKRDATQRHKTLEAAIEWSYRLLTPELQRFFARLSVFRGGWTTEAAEAVCEQPLALDYLAQLRECSLVLVEEEQEGAGKRFRMLESLREYAGEQMTAEERAYVEHRHAEYYLALAEEAEPQLMGREQTFWLSCLETDHDNLRAVLTWCKSADKGVEIGLRLAGALSYFWMVRGYLSEGREWLEGTLARDGASERGTQRAKALYGMGQLTREQGDYTAARLLHEESLSIFRELGDRESIAKSLNELGLTISNHGHYPEALALHEESLAIFRALGNKWGIADLLHALGNMAYVKGDYAAARSYYVESLATAQEIDDRQGIAWFLRSLGVLAKDEGDHASARSLIEESLTIFQEVGDKEGISESRRCLGNVAADAGDYALARSLYEDCLLVWRELGAKNSLAMTLHSLGFVAYQQRDFAEALSRLTDSLGMFQVMAKKSGLVYSLERFGGLAVAQERMERAGRLLGAAASLREALGAPLPLPVQREYDLNVAAVRTALGEEAFAAAWAEGRTMTLEQAIVYALEEEAV